jgi:arginase family enzyme
VRTLALECNLVAMDVVEVSPPYDVSENTVNAAHRVVFEALAGLAAKKRRAAGGHATVPGHVPS